MENTQQFVTVERFEKLTLFLGKLTKRLDAIEAANKKISQRLEEMADSKGSGSDDDSDWEGFGPKPVRKPINPNAETYTVELSHGPFTIYRDDGENDEEWEGRKRGVRNDRAEYLNSIGAKGFPEQEEKLERMRENLRKVGRPCDF